MRKYVIEISKEGIKKTFIDGNKEYEEVWVRDEEYDARTLGAGITDQLNKNGEFDEEELLELLDADDIDGLWEYFEEYEEYEN